jgi:hypothetical protein
MMTAIPIHSLNYKPNERMRVAVESQPIPLMAPTPSTLNSNDKSDASARLTKTSSPGKTSVS